MPGRPRVPGRQRDTMHAWHAAYLEQAQQSRHYEGGVEPLCNTMTEAVLVFLADFDVMPERVQRMVLAQDFDDFMTDVLNARSAMVND